MREAGLFRIMQPAIYGGYEYGFDALIPVVAEVAAGCGSSGWVFSLGIVHQWLVATMPKEAQDEYWSEPGAISGGSYPPVGKVDARRRRLPDFRQLGLHQRLRPRCSGCSSAA